MTHASFTRNGLPPVLDSLRSCVRAFLRCCCLLLSLAACAANPPAPAEAPRPADAPPPRGEPLYVGVSRSAPPIIFAKDGQTVGVEADLAAALGQALNRQVLMVPAYFPDLINELTADRIDIIMAGMSVTPERAARVAFTDSYLRVGQQALIRAADEATLGTPEAVLATQRRIGVEAGTTAAAFAKGRWTNVVIYRVLSDAIDGLLAGQVDVIIHDSPTVQWEAANRRDIKLLAVPGLFTEEHLAWAVNKSNIPLLEQVNQTLAEWKRTGKLREMVEKWVPYAE